jgi:hypothetical protein
MSGMIKPTLDDAAKRNPAIATTLSFGTTTPQIFAQPQC